MWFRTFEYNARLYATVARVLREMNEFFRRSGSRKNAKHIYIDSSCRVRCRGNRSSPQEKTTPSSGLSSARTPPASACHQKAAASVPHQPASANSRCSKAYLAPPKVAHGCCWWWGGWGGWVGVGVRELPQHCVLCVTWDETPQSLGGETRGI